MIMEISEEEKARLKFGSYYALSGLIMLCIILFFEQIMGKEIPILIDLLGVIAFFLFMAYIALYSLFLYLDNIDE